MTRNDVYKLIDGERDYQDAKFPAKDGFSASPEGFLLVVQELASEAQRNVIQGNLPPLGDGSAIRNNLRKIAATCIRCLEQYGADAR